VTGEQAPASELAKKFFSSKYVIFAEVRNKKFFFNPIVTGGAGTCFRISQEVLFEDLADGCTADAVADRWGRLFLTNHRRRRY
jgi:hypothetical protein